MTLMNGSRMTWVGFDDKISQGAGSLWQRTHTSTMKMGTGFISTYLDKIDAMDNVTIVQKQLVNL